MKGDDDFKRNEFKNNTKMNFSFVSKNELVIGCHDDVHLSWKYTFLFQTSVKRTLTLKHIKIHSFENISH